MLASLDGIDVYYERRGSGPRLVLCNGTGMSIATSGMLIDAFAASFDVLVHDQRGLGKTSVPERVPSMADYAADVATLSEHVGWTTFRMVGVSFGGMVAQEFAVTWPERVDRLALLCTSAGGAGGSSSPLPEPNAMAPAEQAAARVRLLDTRFTPEWLDSHPADARLVDLLASRRSRPTSADRLRGQEGQLEARRHHDVWDRLSRISCPTLVAAGRYDGIAPPANSEAIASRVPGAELRTYEGGHAFLAQDPCAMPEVVGFLAGSGT